MAKKGILDRVADQTKRKYGRTALSIEVLERALGEADALKLVKKYEGSMIRICSGVRLPSDEEEKMFDDHLNFHGGIGKFAASIHKKDSRVRNIIYRVAYYRLVVKKQLV